MWQDHIGIRKMGYQENNAYGHHMARGIQCCRNQHRDGHGKINTQIGNDIQNSGHDADQQGIFHTDDHQAAEDKDGYHTHFYQQSLHITVDEGTDTGYDVLQPVIMALVEEFNNKPHQQMPVLKDEKSKYEKEYGEYQGFSDAYKCGGNRIHAVV